MRFYLGLNDNRFCPGESNLVLLEQKCSCKNRLAPLGQFPLSFFSLLSPPQKEEKTEN